MKQVKKETVEEEDPNEMFFEIFNQRMRGAYILSIPHSSILIPDKSAYTNIDAYVTDQLYLTSFSTDKIFAVDGVRTHIFPYSQIYCDVTRFLTDDPMDKKGHGICYTKSIFGDSYRNEGMSDEVLRVYKEYHDRFDVDIDNAIQAHGVAIIVDCYSFLDFPLPIESKRSKKPRPDICLGYDMDHLPMAQADTFLYRLQAQGLSVSTNNPYKGSFVPQKYYGKNKKVLSISIGVNKRLYSRLELNEENRIVKVIEDTRNIRRMNKIMRGLFE